MGEGGEKRKVGYVIGRKAQKCLGMKRWEKTEEKELILWTVTEVAGAGRNFYIQSPVNGRRYCQGGMGKASTEGVNHDLC